MPVIAYGAYDCSVTDGNLPLENAGHDEGGPGCLSADYTSD